MRQTRFVVTRWGSIFPHPNPSLPSPLPSLPKREGNQSESFGEGSEKCADNSTIAHPPFPGECKACPKGVGGYRGMGTQNATACW